MSTTALHATENEPISGAGWWRAAAALCVVAFMLLLGSRYVAFSRLPPLEREGWPPRQGDRFPAVDFISVDGASVQISQYFGRPILLEYVGMSSPVSQAWAGAVRMGAMGDAQVSGALPSVAEMLVQHAPRAALGGDSWLWIQVLMFDPRLESPTPAQLRAWREHFGLGRYSNVIVLGGTSALRGQETYELVPGFQLLGADGAVLMDSTGRRPRRHLFKEVLPALNELLSQAETSRAP